MASTDSAETENATTSTGSYSKNGRKLGRPRKDAKRQVLSLERGKPSNGIPQPPEDITPPSSSKPFKVVKTIHETSHKQSIYAVAFNHYDKYGVPMVATAARNMINVYYCTDTASKLELRRTIVDTNKCEDFYAVEWCYDQVRKKPLIIVSGENGTVKVVDPVNGTFLQEKFGHGETINELRTDPNNSMIFASVSKDNSIRIWHLEEPEALIVFAGQKGHVDQVLSCDWSPDSNYLLTCSMDHSIRLWMLDSLAHKIIRDAMNPVFNDNFSSSDEDENVLQRVRPARRRHHRAPYFIQFPNNECTDLHTDYVDCVRFLGWYIISKGSEQVANLFRFGHISDDPARKYVHKTDRVTTLIRQLSLPTCDVWFLKFDISPKNDWIVFGGSDGSLYFFDLNNPVPDDTVGFTKENFRLKVSNRAIRQVVFDVEGDNIVVVGDDNCVIRLQRNNV